LVHGVKYIFGYKSKYGAWDEFIFNSNDADKLQELVDYLKQQNENEKTLS
jgi:ethanolamine utilization protein EutP (predicted NTPase)